MRLAEPSNWAPELEGDGLLFFTQRIKEMLFHYTNPIHKAPVLNTFLLAREYLETASLVQNGTINSSHLKAIMDEFQFSFQSDIIIQNNISEENQKRLLNKLNSATTEERNRIMEYVLYLLRDYNEWCKAYLKVIVPQGKEKKKIDKTLKCFVPGLIGAGYSQEYIYYFNRKVFSETRVTSLSSLNTFLDRFDFIQRNYVVYIAVEKDVLQYKVVLEDKLGIRFEGFEKTSKLRFDKAEYTLLQMSIKALDERTAANIANTRLNLFYDFYSYISDQGNDWVYNTAEVFDNEGNVAYVDLKRVGLVYDRKMEKAFVAKATDVFVSGLLKNQRGSFRIINRAVNAHNTAIADKDLSNRFLNLWSVLEILFVADGSDSKINEIEKKLLPVLVLDYYKTLISSMSEIMTENTSEESLQSIKTEIANCPSELPWEWGLVGLKCNSKAREKAIEIFTNYPLIRTRIVEAFETISDKKTLGKEIDRYTQRISWHLKRLYRTRNIIIHSGETPMFLDSLVEHLHGYVDEGLFELLFRLSLDNDFGTIDNVVIQLQLNREELAQIMKDGKKTTAEDLVKLKNI